MFIQQTLVKLIIFLTFISCTQSNPFKDYQKSQLLTKSGDKLEVIIALSRDQQQKGLSNIKADEFKDNQVMLFTGEKTRLRQFWMPETFFDLDIVFLTKDLYIIDIHRGVKHHAKKYPRSEVPISKSVFCTHVLEIKSSSPLAQKIQAGDYLKWNGSKSLSQILQDTH